MNDDMTNLLVASMIVVVVAGVALVLRRRRPTDAPTQKQWSVPSQIDRADLRDDESGQRCRWTVLVFTSGTCHVCADVVAKATAVRSRHVAVREVEYSVSTEIHRKYSIDAVPTLLVCDDEGVVRRHFQGPVSATDLWAAVAAVRDGVDAEPCRDQPAG